MAIEKKTVYKMHMTVGDTKHYPPASGRIWYSDRWDMKNQKALIMMINQGNWNTAI